MLRNLRLKIGFVGQLLQITQVVCSSRQLELSVATVQVYTRQLVLQPILSLKFLSIEIYYVFSQSVI